MKANEKVVVVVVVMFPIPGRGFALCQASLGVRRRSSVGMADTGHLPA